MTTTLEKPGTVMPDGSVYAGVSPDTGRPMYTTPKDAQMSFRFNQAGKYAATLDAHGRQDWRVPTKAELYVLFKNRSVIGNFDTTGSPASWYWSSSRHYINSFAWEQRFSDGGKDYLHKGFDLALRCVRG